ncbi:hypothetical protein like AT2G28200 [Hibiscus trionum]|uniref:C2H2-type domain-containing protein n=1 Tax=Hibiscus trionum TaxID=183268 RepID=A0A9W7IJA4_HIBTR|nr:hypothetical protein like AT2G28200 [Hibiscus trionum]
MQAQEEFLGFNDRRALIMKGKRTKRRRSSSPFGVSVTSSSSSGGGIDGGGVAEEYNSISSPTTSGDRIYESTEEEEEMANCLIMLAQSDGPKRSEQFYVHECKTCNRSFPSFQALGGHMASHKKAKGARTEHRKPLVLTAEDDPDIALRVSNKKGNKIHECSICGSEFTSGQALGGHMRRHRAASASNRSATNVDRISIDTASESNKILLDLNLPAPEDDLRDSQFQFGTPQQAIVFSAPALVDCHY